MFTSMCFALAAIDELRVGLQIDPIFYTGCLKSSNTGRPILYNDFQFLFTVVATCSPRLTSCCCCCCCFFFFSGGGGVGGSTALQCS